MGDDKQLDCFPKISGPPGAPPDNWQTYVRRRVTAEVNAALDERSRREEQSSRNLPPFPPVPPSVSLPAWALEPGSDRPPLPRTMGPGSGSTDRPMLAHPPVALPPPPALLTLSAGSSYLTIHDRELANSLVRQGMENLLGRAPGSSGEPSMYREHRERSRSPVLRRVPRRQQTQHEALEDTRGEYAASTVVPAPKAAGDSLPRPSHEWHRLVLDDGEWGFRFQYSGAPAMRTSSTEVAHVVWNTMFCCRTVAGIVLADFHPAQYAASHPKLAEMQRLLKYFRGAIMSDPYRLEAAVELEVVMWDAVHTQLQRIRMVLSSVPSLPMLQQRHMDNGLTARWLIDPEDGPSSRQACPKGVYVVLTAALPDDSQTICAVPLAHNTVPQDCQSSGGKDYPTELL